MAGPSPFYFYLDPGKFQSHWTNRKLAANWYSKKVLHFSEDFIALLLTASSSRQTRQLERAADSLVLTESVEDYRGIPGGQCRAFWYIQAFFVLLSAPKYAMPASSEVRSGNLNHTAKEAAVPAKRRRIWGRRRAKTRQCEMRAKTKHERTPAPSNSNCNQREIPGIGSTIWPRRQSITNGPVPCENSGMRNAGLQTLQYSTVLPRVLQYWLISYSTKQNWYVRTKSERVSRSPEGTTVAIAVTLASNFS